MHKRIYFIVLFLLVTLFFCDAQTIIKMEKAGGVYKIPCKVNGLSLKFIFDTGASDVSLSLTEALFMLKNGYLSDKDFLGTEYYRIANGDIQEGTKVNLKTLEVGGQKIYNVQASISHTLNAPLLFGQSALQRFGKFSIDYSTNTLSLGVGKNNGANPSQTLSVPNIQDEIICQDIDGNLYKISQIGNQIWMAEDLKVKLYNNGDKILIQEGNDAVPNTKGRIDSGYLANDSYRYNWYAIQEKRKLCPKGWHIPSREEVEELIFYFGFSVGKEYEYVKQGECHDVYNVFDEFSHYWLSDLSTAFGDETGLNFGTYCKRLGIEETEQFISKINIYFPDKDGVEKCRCIKD